MDMADTSTLLSTRYMDYPTTKPFINTDFKREDRPVNAYPTSDRDAVIAALRTLQGKMNKLEIDRRIAEQSLHSLASETEKYKEHLTSGSKQSGANKATIPSTQVSGVESLTDHQAKVLKDQLKATENRCQQLGKQLEYMHEIAKHSQRNSWELKEKTARARQEREAAGSDNKLHLDRLNELERDQAKLMATQSLAERLTWASEHPETKIRELENRMKEEKSHRKTLQEKTAQLETVTARSTKIASDSQKPPIRSYSAPARVQESQILRAKKTTRKKKKKLVPAKHSVSSTKVEPRRHYHLNLNEIPFVAGKSTGPSHSLGANFQKVLSMLKSHNNILCSNSANINGCRTESPSSTGSSVTSIDQDLGDLLVQLQDELGHLNTEHHRVLDQMHYARDMQIREDLEQELDSLVAKMAAKSQQISMIRQHQQKDIVQKMNPASSRLNDKPRRPHVPGSCPLVTYGHHHHHVSNKNNHAHPKILSSQKPEGSTGPGNAALHMLKEMKRLQTTLRKDDLSWD
ncbi:unnamed protein product [Lymnaea stagnalis]|uniref:Uncharacterized protein n=1 Tax=Lymnaea stagnalis TaxID=6523 RepID=A0AAV2I286_LYMST